MGLYRDVIFPAMYDRAMRGEALPPHRAAQLAGLSGEVLEVGMGTGLNLPHYPLAVERIVAVEPNPGMNKRLERRIAASGRVVEQHRLSGTALPFDAGRFPFVVSTLTLCSIREVERATAEIRRVLAPGGRFVFLEHGLSEDPGVARWQRRLDGLQRLYAAGCSLTLDLERVLATAGFGGVEIERFQLANTPRIHGCMYRGTATA